VAKTFQSVVRQYENHRFFEGHWANMKKAVHSAGRLIYQNGAICGWWALFVSNYPDRLSWAGRWRS